LSLEFKPFLPYQNEQSRGWIWLLAGFNEFERILGVTASIEQKVREFLSEVRDGQDYTKASVDIDFEEAGLDSLDTASLLLAVQEAYNVDISDDDASDLTTIRKLVDYIAART
jgi:acyl carrier protein